MRITGGAWRSRRLRGPGRGFALRPTPDALRERAFAILGDRFVDRSVLDLYAGTGAVGLEALSRGADRVVFVERHRAAARLIEANCTALGVSENRAKVIARPALQVILELARRDEVFGMAWADPPFDMWHDGLDTLAAAFETGVLNRDAIACLECPEKADLGALPESLRVERDLTGGASRLVMIVTP